MSEASEVLSRVERVPFRGSSYVEAKHLDRALLLLKEAEIRVHDIEETARAQRYASLPAPRDPSKDWQPQEMLVDETIKRLGPLDRLFNWLFGPTK